MPTYLLLRDNKQSGPFSLDEMIAKGFKKYDLVWAEGKSAAWRYPGEIEEFKSFAPPVEEQPFDRFFKKPSQEKKETIAESKQSATSGKALAKAGGLAENGVIVEVGNRKIYTTIPAKKNQPENNVLAQPDRAAAVYEKPEKEIDLPPEANDRAYLQKNHSTPNLNEAGASNAHKATRPAFKAQFDFRRYVQPSILATSVFALLGTGIFIGMSISRSSPDSPGKNSSLSNERPAINNETGRQPNNAMQAATPVPLAGEQLTDGNTNSQATAKNNEQNKPATANMNGATSIEKKRNEKKKMDEVAGVAKISPKQTEAPDSDAASFYVPRKTVRQPDVTNGKENIKANISDLVSVSANNYNVGTFGGISELQLTLSNRSIYPLDLVMVEVQYIQANKKVYKMETLYYRNVRPGEAIMQEAPRSPRGIKVNYKIAFINSKEPALSYTNI
ncbi:MAG: DUF4339 domain-containing protein [Bacteroidetes bacterium]|nr:DUF4339 domain-containing protein [Bacteroidota bacterium]MBS1972883.1 DUF4339 domain-containing protein [Bacteroidota bacterium]